MGRKGKKPRDAINSPEERDRLAASVEGLVIQLVNDYVSAKRCNYLYDDLMQAARLGALRAADLFDTSLGNTFTTYAYPYIEGYIKRASKQERKHHHASMVNKDGELIDVAAPEEAMELDTTEEANATKNKVASLLGYLTPLQRHFVTAYFFEDKTLESIAIAHGCSRQSVHCMIEQALAKMKNPPATKVKQVKIKSVKVKKPKPIYISVKKIRTYVHRLKGQPLTPNVSLSKYERDIYALAPNHNERQIAEILATTLKSVQNAISSIQYKIMGKK